MESMMSWSTYIKENFLPDAGLSAAVDEAYGAVMRLSTKSMMFSSLGLSQYFLSTTAALPSQLYSSLIAQKVAATAHSFDGGDYPQYTTRDTGTWLTFSVNTWTSGFFPATLYEMNTRKGYCPSSAGSTNWLSLGRAESGPLSVIETVNTVQHDVGFISFPFQAELVVNPSNSSAKNAIRALAQELAARYSPIVGCTRSWDSPDPDFQVIIDNMMNLQLFFASNALTPNSTLINMAISHADKTITNHIRADGGSFHVVDYNSTTGKVFNQRTSQGFSDSSTWSRGQAWGIYGFALMYQNTNLQRYLDTATKMGNYFISHTPASGIIPWDFQAPGNPPPADTSASMIAANAFLLLSQLDSANSGQWQSAALNLFTATTNFAWKPSWQSLLSNGTVNNPVGNNDTGTVYGDYYFIKGGNSLIQMGLATCS